jgi:hypothetical protein
MKQIKEIVRLRLQHQLLSIHPFRSAYEVVKWLGAVQAQDYLGSLWAIGSRIENSTEAMIEKAIADREIVRSWPMRGTLHFTAPEDLRWMQNLLAPRIIKKAASVYRKSELDEKVFTKGARIITKALEKNPILTRDELYETLERSKIVTAETRGLHILGWTAQKGLICLAPRKGKQFTFTLLDNWIPATKAIDQQEAFSRLALTYFKSHGPATVHDFSWWTGLTLTEAKQALEIVKENLTEIKSGTLLFYFIEEFMPNTKPKAYLLPAYDEYTVGYKDRSAFLDEKHIEKARNGIFSPCILMNGQIAGTWKRTLDKRSVNVETTLFAKLPPNAERSLGSAIKDYKRFLGVDLPQRHKVTKNA